ncbi:class II aldolase/adducin family protein [Rhodobaculum claviforme]|uniref:Class II aldolase n=1 Tax=Rhodobaculum claviforme TaxID=1549854 RepID=A0A934TJZ3_9RHOB|nr:class II aldolase/adducin family protein [Rhodobaculum claviforme]MBK5926916.1 class II aldolase [Rhodobaculum claviforme]
MTAATETGGTEAGATDEGAARAALVAGARTLDRAGLNRGASGNLSVRFGDGMLITPSAVPPAELTPELIARMGPDGDGWDGPLKPSTEWRFHRDLLAARPDLGAVVHTHAPWCTVLAVARRPIPAVHYMIAAFGGADIRVADYARFGTAELSAHVVAAMEGRFGCLMANHGMLTAAPTLARALWLAAELEALAHQAFHAEALGGAVALSQAQVAEAARAFAGYGLRTG